MPSINRVHECIIGMRHVGHYGVEFLLNILPGVYETVRVELAREGAKCLLNLIIGRKSHYAEELIKIL